VARFAIAMQPPETRPCAALTRSGSNCRREARAGSSYCPSHRHWDDEAESEIGVAAA